MHWNIDPILITIGPLQLHWYGLLFATGLLLAYYLTEWIFKKESKNYKLVEPLFLYIVIGMVIGARLAHVLFYDLSYYLKHPIEILYVWKGGLASHGGFFGVIIAIWLFCKKYNFNFLWLLSRLSIGAMLIATFIRVGNFFNSEIVGIKSNSSFGVIFDRVDNILRHPVVLYEAFAYFLIFLILLNLYIKLTPKKYTNLGFGLVLVLGFGSRVFLEQFKTIQSQFATDLPLSMGQILSLPYIVAGIILLIISLKNLKSS